MHSDVALSTHVVYRAMCTNGREIEMHLISAPEAAAMPKAWARLGRLQLEIDPTTLEIEIHCLATGTYGVM